MVLRRLTRNAAYAIVALGLLLGLGPFLVPVGQAPGTVPPEELADPDSRFLDFRGVRVHYKVRGDEASPQGFLLLHGFGASVFSWREVMEPLSRRGRVLAVDLPGFGLTSRPARDAWQDGNPYASRFRDDLLSSLLDVFQMERAILVGSSLGGRVALDLALAHPERVQALVLASPAVYGGGPPAWVRPLLALPQGRRLGPLLLRHALPHLGGSAIRAAWHDPARLTPEIREGYRKPLRAENWDLALWELSLASDDSDGISDRLGQVQAPALLLTGDDDRVIPPADTEKLAAELPDARLVVLPRCGHLPQEECPQAFLDAVAGFLEGPDSALPSGWPGRSVMLAALARAAGIARP